MFLSPACLRIGTKPLSVFSLPALPKIAILLFMFCITSGEEFLMGNLTLQIGSIFSFSPKNEVLVIIKKIIERSPAKIKMAT